MPAFAARTEMELEERLAEADEVIGPALIAATIDGRAYLETIARLRG